MKPSEILKKALEILGPNGEHWTKGTYARLPNGNSGDVCHGATCFCGIGALRVAVCGSVSMHGVCMSKDRYSYATARFWLERATPNGSWTVWQDYPQRHFSEVKAKFIEAFDMAKERESQAAA